MRSYLASFLVRFLIAFFGVLKRRHFQFISSSSATQVLFTWSIEPAVFACAVSLSYSVPLGFSSPISRGLESKPRARHVQNFVMAAGGESIAKYVGHKIAKTRWSPALPGQFTSSDIFTTGGWDNKVNLLTNLTFTLVQKLVPA